MYDMNPERQAFCDNLIACGGSAKIEYRPEPRSIQVVHTTPCSPFHDTTRDMYYVTMTLTDSREPSQATYDRGFNVLAIPMIVESHGIVLAKSKIAFLHRTHVVHVPELPTPTIAPIEQTYFMHAVGSGRVKIGRAKNVDTRRIDLQCGCPYPIEVLTTIPHAEAPEIEMHKRFARYRVCGEWFTLAGELELFIASVAESAANCRSLPSADTKTIAVSTP